MMKHKAKVDVAVLIQFFNRPEQLSNIFGEIRKARPSRLFLYQDGPRNERDMEGIMACRKVVEDIDWECDVRRMYQERNFGCDPSGYISQRWAFSMADKCILFEDDDLPSQSFFPFCKELLDRYENDERIGFISGMNYDEVTEGIPYDYFFSTTLISNGWATWRRVVDTWDETYTFLDDSYDMQQLEALIKERKYQQKFTKMCRYHRSKGVPYYETISQASMFFGFRLCITPRVNLINNGGATGEGVHLSGTNDELPKALRRIFTMGRHELDFPLRHPRHVIEDIGYKKRVYRTQAWGHPWIKAMRSVEELLINLRRGNFRRIGSAIVNRVKILTGHSKYD